MHTSSLHPSQIPVFILAGGLGTRLSEETTLKPKPMVEIGEIPILVHLMRWYYKHGFNDFVICGGYRCWEIKNYFLTYEFRKNNLVIDHRETPDMKPCSLGRNEQQERWRVRVIDTGLDCMTGGRIARAFDIVSAEQKIETFAVTYGDGLSDIDLKTELSFHQKHGKMGTMLGVAPSARFGEIETNADGLILDFLEKPESKQGLINGGFFFFQKEYRKYMSDDASCIMEKKPLETIVKDEQMMMYPHKGFWQPMDALRDKMLLEKLWNDGKAPWFHKT